MSEQLRVLIVEDSDADVELILYTLRQDGFEPTWSRVRTEAELREHIDPALDVILADFSLPTFDAAGVLRVVKELEITVPVIIVTGAIGEEAISLVLREGGADYLFKDRITRLGSAVRRAVQARALSDASLAAARALEESEARYRHIFESTVEGMYRSSLETGLEMVNPAAARMMGFDSPEEILASVSSMTDFYVDPADRGILLEDLRTSGSVQGYELRLRGRQGKRLLASVTAHAVYGPSGEMTHIEGSMIEVTESRRAALILEAVRQTAEGLLSASSVEDEIPAILARIGLAAEIDRAWSGRVELAGSELRFSGYADWNREGLAGLTFPAVTELSVSDPKVRGALEPLLQGDTVVITTQDLPDPIREVVEADGTSLAVVAPILTSGSLWGLLGFQSLASAEAWTDQATDALRAAAGTLGEVLERRIADERYQSLVERVPAIVYRAHAGTREAWDYISPQIESILGYTAAEWTASPGAWLAAMHPDDLERVVEAEDQSARSHQPIRIEYRMFDKRGEIVWIREEAEFESTPGGSPLLMQGLLYDITDSKLAEAELTATLGLLRAASDERGSLLSRLKHAEEAERGRLAADIHDDSLQAITAVGLRLHRLKGLVDAEAADIVGQLESSVAGAIERLRRLTFELRPRSLDEDGIATALREYLTLMEGHTGIGFRLTDEMAVKPDGEIKTAMFRVALEALANVRKHSFARRVTIELSLNGDYSMRISDDGQGFDVAEGATSPAGHLGLSAMRERCEAAGGRFQITSSAEGTTVEFNFPAEMQRP